MGRYAVFIDGAYLDHALRPFGKPKVDLLKLSRAVSQNDERLRTYYYHCPPYVSAQPTAEERSRQSGFDRFKGALERLPRFEVRLGRLARRSTPQGGVDFQQKKVDVLLAVDLVRLSATHQIQRAVLFAGDADYVPAIDVARREGVVVELYYSRSGSVNDELLDICDDRIPIDEKFVDCIKQEDPEG